MGSGKTPSSGKHSLLGVINLWCPQRERGRGSQHLGQFWGWLRMVFAVKEKRGVLTLVDVHMYNKQISFFTWYVKISYIFLAFNCYIASLRLFNLWFYDVEKRGTKAFHESRLGQLVSVFPLLNYTYLVCSILCTLSKKKLLYRYIDLIVQAL